MRSLLVFFAASLLPFLALGAPLANNYVETPDHMGNGTVYSISHLFPKVLNYFKGLHMVKIKVFMKTDEFNINYEMCVQYRFKLTEKKVKWVRRESLGEDWPLHSTILGSFTPSQVSRQESAYPLHPWVHWLFRRLPIAPSVPLGACLTHWGFIHIPRQPARVKTEQSAETAASLKGWHWLSSRRVKNYGNGRKK